MRVIKKYSNRRLYDTGTSAYINLDDLATLVQNGEEVQVVDVKTGDDLTRGVLLQVILEVEGGADLLPVGLLHRIIRHGGNNPAQQVALRQLSQGLEMLDRQFSTFERQFGFWKADEAPPTSGSAPQPDPPAGDSAPDDRAPEDRAGDDGEELDELRQRLADLEQRLKG